ncbi:MAG TPA: hypothetical protein VGW37_10350 [Terriglobia bacterium]|nr:hypothetical protein [Terriglobia bacterium]
MLDMIPTKLYITHRKACQVPGCAWSSSNWLHGSSFHFTALRRNNMKSRAHSLLLRLAKAATRKAFMIITVATLAVVATGMGVWTHKAYAAKARAEMAAKQQAATLNDVMAKLNKIESEMQQQTRSMNVKLEALEYQNAKLAAYEVRQRAESPLFQLAAARTPIRPATAGTLASTLTIPLELDTEVCDKGSLTGGGKLSIEPRLEADAKGDVGAEAFGNGVDAEVEGRIDTKLGFELGGEHSFEKNTCLKIAQFNIFGNSTPTVNVGQFISGLTTGADVLANKLAQLEMNLPQLANSVATTGLDDLNNSSLSFSPQQILQNLENPKQALQSVTSLFSAIPLPQGIGNLFQDPSSLFPQPSDFSVTNLCASQGSGGLLSNVCSLIPGNLPNFAAIPPVIQEFTNVQGDLANFKTGLGNICGSVNNVVSGVDGFSLQIPPANLPVPSGISFTPPTLAFHVVTIPIINYNVLIPNGISAPPPTLLFHNVPVGGVTLPSPIQLQPLSCSGL